MKKNKWIYCRTESEEPSKSRSSCWLWSSWWRWEWQCARWDTRYISLGALRWDEIARLIN